MRVSPIGLYDNSYKSRNNSKQNIKLIQNHPSNQDSRPMSIVPVTFIPYKVNFTGHTPRLLRFADSITTLNFLCPYSGIPMVPRPIFDRVLSFENLEGNGDKIIKAPESVKVLSRFVKNLHKAEASVFETLKRESELHPDQTLQEILAMLKPNSLEVLKSRQTNIFYRIDILCKGLPKELGGKITALTDEARRVIKENNPDNPFSSRAFIGNIARLENDFKDKRLFKQIHEAALKLLDVKNKRLAFIVKYAEEGSHKIGQRLVEPSVMSFEHIVLESDEGLKSCSNGLIVSRGFNEERANTPFADWIRMNPEIPTRLKKYMSFVISLINKKNLTRYADYPAAVAPTLFEESGGVIKLDISALRVKPPENIVGETKYLHFPSTPFDQAGATSEANF